MTTEETSRDAADGLSADESLEDRLHRFRKLRDGAGDGSDTRLLDDVIARMELLAEAMWRR